MDSRDLVDRPQDGFRPIGIFVRWDRDRGGIEIEVSGLGGEMGSVSLGRLSLKPVAPMGDWISGLVTDR